MVFLHEELAVHLVGGVFDEQFVLVPGEDDADGRVVALDVLLGGEVAEIHVHLADVVVLEVVDLQIDEDKAAQDAMVKDEIDPVMGVVESDAVLPTDEGKTFAKFEEEGLEVIAEAGFQIRLRNLVRLGDFQELEDVGIAEQVGGLGDDLTLGGKLKDRVLVLSGGEAEEERGFFLAFQLTNGPFLPNGLLLIKSAFERIVDLQQLDNVRPTQLVRQRRTFWVSEVELANSHHIAAAETLAVAKGQVAAETVKQALAVDGTSTALLLELDNVPPNLPIGLGDMDIDGLRRPGLSRGVNLGDFSQKALVAGVGGQVVALMIDLA